MPWKSQKLYFYLSLRQAVFEEGTSHVCLLSCSYSCTVCGFGRSSCCWVGFLFVSVQVRIVGQSIICGHMGGLKSHTFNTSLKFFNSNTTGILTGFYCMIYVTCLIKGYVGIHVHTIINSLVQILILFLSLAITREKKMLLYSQRYLKSHPINIHFYCISTITG